MKKLLRHPEGSEGPREHSRCAADMIGVHQEWVWDPSPSARLGMTPRGTVSVSITGGQN